MNPPSQLRSVHALALFFVIACASWLMISGLQEAGFFLPTYDNSMLHAGRARVILETGHWAEMELVFGGITKSYHLPMYPAIAAGLEELSGLDLWWTIRLLTLLISGILFPLAFYSLAKRVSGSWIAGVSSAAIALMLPNLMTWGTRNSPIGLGVVMVVFLLDLLAAQEYVLTAFGGIGLALLHQPSLLAFGLALFTYFLISVIRSPPKNLSLKSLPRPLSALFLIGALALGTYLLWHVRQTGTTCLNFACLPHLSSHEYGNSINLVDYFSLLPRALALGGLAVLAFSREIKIAHKLLLASWFLALLILIKNDVLGIAVFTVRFTTFFDCALAVLAGIFVGFLAHALVSKLAGRTSVEIA